jgi:hypothetical protein
MIDRIVSAFRRRLGAAGAPIAPVAPVETATDITATAQLVERRFATERGYRFAAGCPETLLATTFGVCALETMGALDALSEARRATLTAYLKSCQAADGGLFRDERHDDAFVYGLKKFTPRYIEWQETYFALHALDALGAEPDHALSFVEPYQRADVMDGWMRMLRFDDFWFSSNYLMFLLCFLLRHEGAAAPSAHRLLDRLDERQDPNTGLWGTTQGSSLFNGMAGAFHVYGFYRHLDRPIHHQGAALRSTLRTQLEGGLFGTPGGGPCEDLDGVDILVNLQPDDAADERAVTEALGRTLTALRSCRLPDGGYRWTAPLPGAKVRKVTYSGLPSLSVQSDDSDLWSMWFRPLAIALACHRLGRGVSWPVQYRSFPLLGYGPNA